MGLASAISGSKSGVIYGDRGRYEALFRQLIALAHYCPSIYLFLRFFILALVFFYLFFYIHIYYFRFYFLLSYIKIRNARKIYNAP